MTIETTIEMTIEMAKNLRHSSKTIIEINYWNEEGSTIEMDLARP